MFRYTIAATLGVVARSHGEDWLIASPTVTQSAKIAVGELAGRQSGRVARRQLTRLGVSSGAVAKWAATGYLFRVLPGVYGVGHAAPSVRGDLAAALLYAGPGAMLSHATAAWWHGLLKHRPATIDVTTLRRCRPLPAEANVRVHDRRKRTRVWLGGLPLTTVEETLRDCAGAGCSVNDMRLLLAEADYRRLLRRHALLEACGRGHPGSAILRTALARHLPILARTRSPLEADFIFVCEAAGIPLPEVNVRVAGITVDALWREQRLVVELDGRGNHGTPAQIERDRGDELRLRQVGMLVLRYTRFQIAMQYALVAPDLRAAYGRNAK